jgi:hypothetical protein
VDKKTVERKLIYLGIWARIKNKRLIEDKAGTFHTVQLDDLITKENSKLKPLSVSVAADEKSRLILGAEVSQIPAFGHLTKLALKKYGPREDQHEQGLRALFTKLLPLLPSEVLIKSDEHQRYPYFVKNYFPRALHMTFKSERACVAGQGELKKVHFDPLFVINHTCAMLRANVNRLIRKTWCTTKMPARLQDHIDLFIYFYNKTLLRPQLTPL